MKTTLKLEELAQFILSIYIFNQLSYAWWYFLAFVLLPDIGMLGYLINNKIGAFTYNLFHHKGIALVFLISGWQSNTEWVIFIGLILFGHAALDRIMGYGLKFEEGFKHTHLGQLN